ncbi:MAG TPA: YbbC/YhhH family protein [Candidatus Angelobacter sp.]|nr:YbbC/YhhH family protein [Candidatus Angelobacter sp.]
MVRHLFVPAVLMTILLTAHSQNPTGPTFQPKNGFVPNAETAVKIAEAVLIPIYGEKQILSERPFKASREGEVWTVSGTLPPGYVGGVAVVKISKRTGEILSVVHFK